MGAAAGRRRPRGQGLREVGQHAVARVRGRGGGRRQDRAGPRVRDVRPRARDAQRRRHRLRGRLGLEAIHGRGGDAPRPRREAEPRRLRPQVPSRAARLRRPPHHPPHAHPHQRPPRLGRGGRGRGLAAGHAGHDPEPGARGRGPPARAQLPERDRVLVQQQRLQPRRAPRVPRLREVLRRVHARAHLRSPRHDPHGVARRLPAHRQGPRARVREGRGGLARGDAQRGRARQRRAADHGRRSPALERRPRRGDAGRTQFRRRRAAGGRAGRRPPHSLRDGPVRRHLEGRSRDRPRWRDRRLSRGARPVPGLRPLRRRALQRG